MKFIHIAGTNGKGSCVELITNILINSGYIVAKFISPHLIKYNERISINKKEISDKEIKTLIKSLTPVINQYMLDYHTNITVFEAETMIALLYFYQKKPDIVILETGLGGLYDCTNIITHPLISVITSISYDHMDILGHNLSDIALQKAGIIKPNSNTILFEQSQKINQIFIKIAKAKNNKLYIIKKDQILNYRVDSDYQYFDFGNYQNICVGLKGKKQVQNAAICIKATDILNQLGFNINEIDIRSGIKNTVNKGRMEILCKSPLIIYDGAHNQAAIKNFLEMMDIYYKDFKRVYVVSILKRKDYKKMLEILMKDKEAEFIFTSGKVSEQYMSKKDL